MRDNRNRSGPLVLKNLPRIDANYEELTLRGASVRRLLTRTIASMFIGCVCKAISSLKTRSNDRTEIRIRRMEEISKQENSSICRQISPRVNNAFPASRARSREKKSAGQQRLFFLHIRLHVGRRNADGIGFRAPPGISHSKLSSGKR